MSVFYQVKVLLRLYEKDLLNMFYLPRLQLEHNKSKYQATSSHEFGVVTPTRLPEFDVVRTTSSHEFGLV